MTLGPDRYSSPVSPGGTSSLRVDGSTKFRHMLGTRVPTEPTAVDHRCQGRLRVMGAHLDMPQASRVVGEQEWKGSEDTVYLALWGL